MSVSKWRYTEECNGRPCPGDCDHCSFEPGDLISRADALRELNGACSNWEDDAKVAEIINALPSAELTLQTPQTYGKSINPSNAEVVADYISRADAIEAVHEYYQKRFTEDSKWNADAKMFVLEDKTIAKDNMEICNIIKALPSAEAEDRLYIKIYADDEPSVKAEKLYQICDETQNREVAKWLKEYFSSADAVSRKAKCCPIAETCMSIDCPVSSEYIGRLSAEAVQGWIPCSERLPEEGEKVLVSTTNTVFTQVFKGTHGTSDSWWWNNNTIKTIYAWMPLPKPYKGGDDE